MSQRSSYVVSINLPGLDYWILIIDCPVMGYDDANESTMTTKLQTKINIPPGIYFHLLL